MMLLAEWFGFGFEILFILFILSNCGLVFFDRINKINRMSWIQEEERGEECFNCFNGVNAGFAGFSRARALRSER